MKASYKYVYLLVAINIIPHIFDLPLWIIVASLMFLGWKLASDLTRVPVPGKWGTMVLVGICTLFIVNQYGTFFGDEASTATLLIMASLKTFEMKGYRDVMILTYLCYFLLMTKLITSQSIGMTVFMAVDVLLITGFMMMYHSPRDQKNWKRLFRRAMKTAGIGVPLMVALFFAFPRFTANLWGKNTTSQAVTGFSGNLNPGEISKLMSSDETAFRVYFKDQVAVPPSQMYWRGVTLDNSQGLSWGQGAKEEREITNADLSSPDIVAYEIFLEPHGQKWLFALDWPLKVEFPEDPRGFSFEEQGARTYEMRRTLTSRDFYKVYSQPLSNLVHWRVPDPEVNLEVGDTDSPRARVLAFQTKASSKSEIEIVRKFMSLLGNGQYTYSLSPEPVKNIDEFLFEKKNGFCEHYAASFASLLRWAGVPARVVLGYQGGTPSFLADYYIVKQLDAHAWVEYWDSTKATWMRVDPTSVVAPERFMLGAESFNDRLMTAVGTNTTNFRDWFGKDVHTEFLRMRLAFDQLEAAWTGFLIRYDFTYQQQMFSNWGWGKLKRWHLFAFTVLVLGGLGIVLSWRLSRMSRRRSYTQKAYDELCALLASKGLPRRANEGPLAYRARALENFPAANGELAQLFNEILQFRYSRLESAEKAFIYSSYRQIRRQMNSQLKRKLAQ